MYIIHCYWQTVDSFRNFTSAANNNDLYLLAKPGSISYGGSLPAWFNAVMNTLYFGIVSGMAYYFLDYAASPWRKRQSDQQLLLYINSTARLEIQQAAEPALTTEGGAHPFVYYE